MASKGESILQREQAILDEIIRFYMDHHEAISARTLSKISRLSLSPTTIRNLMEDLSTEGFLTTEGVTRGRIPTQKAFAIYVTRLGEPTRHPKAEPPEVAPMEEGRPPALHAAVREMGKFLADHTGCAVLAALPERERYPLDWVKFVSMPNRQVLVTMRTLFGDLWSKLLLSPDPFPDDLLDEVGRFINGTYRGRSLKTVRNDIMAGEPKELLETMPSLGAAFRMLRRAFEWQDEPDRHTFGLDNLYNMPECSSPERMLSIHRILSDPQFLTRTQNGSRKLGRGWISIGTETGYDGLENCALVGYGFGLADWQGYLGVLGPMRMDYASILGLAAGCSDRITRYLQRSAQGSTGG